MVHRRGRPVDLANKLRRIRLALGLSQSELVRLLDPEEVMYYGRISDYELGKREPSLWVLLAYARVAGLHLEYIVDDDIPLPEKLPGDVVYPTSNKSTPRSK